MFGIPTVKTPHEKYSHIIKRKKNKTYHVPDGEKTFAADKLCNNLKRKLCK